MEESQEFLSQCQATEAQISFRAGSHKGYVNWGDLREEIRRSGQGEGDASLRQWVRRIPRQRPWFCDIFNHWTEGDIHIVLGGPSVESHSVTEIISQIAEGDDPSIQELFKGCQKGMKEGP